MSSLAVMVVNALDVGEDSRGPMGIVKGLRLW